MRKSRFMLKYLIPKPLSRAPKVSVPALEGASPWLHNAVSLFCAACLAVSVSSLIVTGCGGSSISRAKAASILITNASGGSGNITALPVASRVLLSMTPLGDSIHAGVDWVVSCGGNPVTGSIANGACGTLSPAHTTDGQPTAYIAPSVVPIGAAVTITATVTSNPSQSSNLTLTIVATPIGVALSSTAPIPNSLQVDTTLNLIAQVTNDPLNAGVAFTATCGSSACGSFNPAISTSGSNIDFAYTAPSAVPTGNTVTITAASLTDTSKSASITITITTPSAPPAVTMSVVPLSLYAQTTGSAHTGHFTAIVANDPQAEGVDWSVSCGASACGTITAHTANGSEATYIAPSAAPPGGTATITAKSTANPSVAVTAIANIITAAPIVATITSAPPPSQTTGTQTTLAAATAGDADNLGVDWTANCGSVGACGSFSLSPAHTASGGQIVYTAPSSVPSGGVVTIMASSPSSAPSNPGIALTTILPQPPSVSFQQAPPSAMISEAQAVVSASVGNDLAPGGVTWSVQCASTVAGGCGWITPSQTASGASATYTAPPTRSAGTAVTITATSVADPASSVTSNPIAISPSTTHSVSFIPLLPSQMQPNATVNLIAAVANDTTNGGVDWQVCSSGCGFFTIKPAIPAIPATPTTPYVPAVPAVTATSALGWSNGLPIPYTAPPQSPSSGTVAILAMAHVDNKQATSGAITINSSSSGPSLNGVVQAGAQTVAGSSVSLYVAGTGGYASAASSIATAITDKNGSFTIPGTYFCPSPVSQMYLVASGGKVGSNNANPNLAFMTLLGNCSSLGSTPVVMNEITSVASAFATAPFTANDALTGNSSYLYLGAGSSNSAGLANAFATFNNLVDITTGRPRYFVPAGNAAAPYVQINIIADMLNSCAATAGGAEGDGSPCGVLFTDTDVLPLQHDIYNAVAPTDTLQAAFNIAQHPVTNFGYSMELPALGAPSNLVSSSSPFQPALSTASIDWPLSLNYTVSGLPATDVLGSFAMDAVGNLWITDVTAGTVFEWNATAAAVSPLPGYLAGGGPIAIDASGNVWVSGNNSLSELTDLGIPLPGTPFAGVPGGGSDLAIDAQGNLWVANDAGVNEFSNLGVLLSPAGGFTNAGVHGTTAIGVDSANDVWVGQSAASTNSFANLANPGGGLIVAGGSNAFGDVFPQMAADNSGNMWATNGGWLCKAPPYAGAGSIWVPTCTQAETTLNSPGAFPFDNARGIAVDGAGTLWVASAGGGSIPPNILPVVSNSAAQSYIASSLAAGPLRVGIDGSGNVWVLLANNTLTEYVGAAAPTANPTALALKNKKLGAKP